MSQSFEASRAHGVNKPIRLSFSAAVEPSDTAEPLRRTHQISTLFEGKPARPKPD
jgi:hypothetical protein